MKLLKKLTALLCGGAMLASGIAEPVGAFAESLDVSVQISANQIIANSGDTVTYRFRLDQNERVSQTAVFRLYSTRHCPSKWIHEHSSVPIYEIPLNEVSEEKFLRLSGKLRIGNRSVSHSPMFRRLSQSAMSI
jgi:hypothetical protein